MRVPQVNDEAKPGTATQDPVLDKASASRLLQLPNLQEGNAETRLIEIFALVENARVQEALEKSTALINDHPNFHLAQLVHGDLLGLRFQPTAASLGNVSDQQAQAATARLLALRTESQQRLSALQNRPPPGTMPNQFVALSDWTRHAIAIDAKHSRLYLFENKPVKSSVTGQTNQLTLIADFFISVGKAGTGKDQAGDNRTPLGTYYITSIRERKTLPPFYGAGALPINYPNAFDVHLGKTGSGIWLHGTPPDQYVRATLASEGCVVLSNPDMQMLLDTVAPRSTPVVISEQLQWVPPEALEKNRKSFETMLSEWVPTHHAIRTNDGKISQKSMATPLAKPGWTKLSLLQSSVPVPGMVATFEETLDGVETGNVRRQYWVEQDGKWQLLQDTLVGGHTASLNKNSKASASSHPGASLTTHSREASIATGQEGSKLRRLSDVEVKAAKVAEKTAKTTNTEHSNQTDKVVARGNEDAVRAAVQSWAKAWSQKNMTAYLKAYDASFVAPNGQSRKAWEQERKERIVPKSKIQVTLSNLTVSVQGNTATVRFVQNYQADQLNVSSRKTLRLVQRNSLWLITQEQVGTN